MDWVWAVSIGIGLVLGIGAGCLIEYLGDDWDYFSMGLGGAIIGAVIGALIALIITSYSAPASKAAASSGASAPAASAPAAPNPDTVEASRPPTPTVERYQIYSIPDSSMPGKFLNATEVLVGQSVGYLISYYSLSGQGLNRAVFLPGDHLSVSIEETGTADPVLIKSYTSTETSFAIIAPDGTVSWLKNPR